MLEDVDRVPISLYGVNPYFKSWRTLDRSYKRLHEVVYRLQDTFVKIPIGDPNFTYFLKEFREKHDPLYYEGIGDLGIFFSSSKDIERKVKRLRKGNSVFFKEIIETPKGSLKAVFRVDDGVATTWQVEPYIKGLKDIDKVLSLPFRPLKPNLKWIKEAQRKIGERGLLVLSVGDPLGVVVPLFKYEHFLFYALSNKNKIKSLMEFFHERLKKLYNQVSREVKDVIFRFWGPEYITPPAMAPKYFEKLVVQYDQDLIETIKRNGNIVCIHCHGKIKAVLEMIKSMKPDILEPIEPPPYGDVTLRVLKNKLGDEICLMGYIEYEDLVSSEPATVRRIVRKVIREGAPGGGYIMIPSAIPIKMPLPVKAEINIIELLKAGREYGLYPIKRL